MILACRSDTVHFKLESAIARLVLVTQAKPLNVTRKQFNSLSSVLCRRR